MRSPRLLLPLLLALFPAGQAIASREVGIGFENLYDRTAESPLNRGNLLGLDPDQDRLRATLAWKESPGRFRGVFRGFLEHDFSGDGATRFTVRQAYVQHVTRDGRVATRLGKQRMAWGSGFAWNPTNRLEPAKNPLDTGLEQEGSLGARFDLGLGGARGSLSLIAIADRSTRDLPYPAPSPRREAAAARWSTLVRDTDLALVVSGGHDQPTLAGADLARGLGGSIAGHVEAALYRGAELPPERDDLFVRVATGILYTRGARTSIALEYFFNAEGYDGSEAAAFRRRLAFAFANASDPGLPADGRAAALAAYAAAASTPSAGGLGLRRHYLYATLERATEDGKWSYTLSAVAGLADGGVAVTPGVRFAPRGDVTLRLEVVALVGPSASEFRLQPLRAAVIGRAEWLF